MKKFFKSGFGSAKVDKVALRWIWVKSREPKS